MCCFNFASKLILATFILSRVTISHCPSSSYASKSTIFFSMRTNSFFFHCLKFDNLKSLYAISRAAWNHFFLSSFQPQSHFNSDVNIHTPVSRLLSLDFVSLYAVCSFFDFVAGAPSVVLLVAVIGCIEIYASTSASSLSDTAAGSFKF